MLFTCTQGKQRMFHIKSDGVRSKDRYFVLVKNFIHKSSLKYKLKIPFKIQSNAENEVQNEQSINIRCMP